MRTDVLRGVTTRAYSVFTTLLKRVSPRRHVQREIKRLKSLRSGPVVLDTSTNPDGNEDFQMRLNEDLAELYNWQQELDDDRLMARARKIGIVFEDIQFEQDKNVDGPDLYHQYGDCGTLPLRDEFRRPLRKAVQERDAAYRKEQREKVELASKMIAAVSGLVGTLIGLVAIWKK